MDRFWSKVARGDQCWLWTASRWGNGYGRFFFDGRRCLAHRMAYELAVGPIPAGYEIHHTCEERLCVNPAHLRAVTAAEHCAAHGGAGDTRAKMSAKTHCPQGHPYDESNTYHYGGRRACRECRRAAGRRHDCKRGWRRETEVIG